MKIATKAVAAFAAGCVLASATAASALTITYPIAAGDPDTLPAGQSLVANFNTDVVTNLTPTPYLYPVLQTGYTLTLEGSTVGYNEGGGGYSGTLAGDPTPYLTVIPGNTGNATLASLKTIKEFSFYMGSPDTYNFIDVYNGATLVTTLSGTNLTNGDTNQQWSWGKRINVDLDGVAANKLVFRSTSFSFELDNIAVAVPEPSSWALMILGFGAAGAMIRRRRTVVA